MVGCGRRGLDGFSGDEFHSDIHCLCFSVFTFLLRLGIFIDTDIDMCVRLLLPA